LTAILEKKVIVSAPCGLNLLLLLLLIAMEREMVIA